MLGCQGSHSTNTSVARDAGDAATIASNPCLSLNAKDLNSAAICYYRGASKDSWRLLSKVSREEMPEDAWASLERPTPVSIKILSEKTQASQTYGLVETVHALKNCQRTETGTWTQEDGAWRRLYRPKTRELLQRQFKNGDYSATANGAEKWLADDPFSVAAYNILIFAIARGGHSAHTPRDVDDSIRALLAVNPKDSTALLTAVSYTTDVDTAEALFDRLPTDDCSRAVAASNLANLMQPRRRLEFLERVGSNDPLIRITLVETLTELHDKRRLAAALTPDAEQSFKELLEKEDSKYAANWSGHLGEAQRLLGNINAAKAWASYGAMRDPNNSRISTLLRSLKR